MKLHSAVALGGLALALQVLSAQAGDLTLPRSIEAGAAFQVDCPGSGSGTLYVVGPGQVLKRDIQLGRTVSLPPGSLYNAGEYMVTVSSSSSALSGSIEVLPASKPNDIAFIAKPSRLPVAQHGAITGTAYVFDSYKNLITQPVQVSFELLNQSAVAQTQTVEARDGAASAQMDSTTHEGKDTFVARVGDIASTRVVGQVPGDPCGLKVNAKQADNRIELTTDPVRDCSGNAVSDGTIVTFTELFNGTRTSVDVPLKKDVATVSMPAHRGATISVASGVVLGNQIRWDQ